MIYNSISIISCVYFSMLLLHSRSRRSLNFILVYPKHKKSWQNHVLQNIKRMIWVFLIKASVKGLSFALIRNIKAERALFTPEFYIFWGVREVTQIILTWWDPHYNSYAHTHPKMNLHMRYSWGGIYWGTRVVWELFHLTQHTSSSASFAAHIEGAGGTQSQRMCDFSNSPLLTLLEDYLHLMTCKSEENLISCNSNFPHEPIDCTQEDPILSYPLRNRVYHSYKVKSLRS